MTYSRQKWNRTVAECIERSNVAQLHTEPKFIDESSQLIVHSSSFNSDFILGELPQSFREKAEIYFFSLMDEKSKSVYKFSLRQTRHPFRKEFIGKEVVSRMLQEDKSFVDPLSFVVDWDISPEGVRLVTNEPKQPHIFSTISTNLFRLYKTYKSSDSRYTFIYRQKGSPEQKKQSVKEKFSQRRVSQILYNISLDCDICSSRNSVTYQVGEEKSDGFTFRCSNCSTSVDPSQIHKSLDGTKSLGHIKAKIKQQYKTGIGKPSK